jgi:hypothetical protein
MNMKKITYILVLLGMFGFANNSIAQINNGGFETGDLSFWVVNGSGNASTGEVFGAWVINPADNYMGFIYPEGALDQAGAEASLGLAEGALVAHNFSLYTEGTTDFSTLYQDVVLAAGQSVNLYWNYVSTDYDPFNDGCFATFVGPSYQEIHTLAVTVDAFGEAGTHEVGTYGSSGWYQVTFTATTAGTYRLGFGAFNMFDQALDPWAFIDNAEGGTSAPGEPIVTTDAVTNIMLPNATSGGEVVDGGSSPAITARGICWNTTGSPTLADDFTVDGSGFGTFTSTLTGLSNGQTYYVRAYATNSVDTYYGGTVTFSTGAVPETPVSNWALILGGIAIAVFTVFRVRKMI